MNWRKNQKIKFSFSKSSLFKQTIPMSVKAWESASHKKLKKDIKYHYSIIQSDICAYCRTPIRFEGYGEHIEHIVPKSKKFRWMFHPENLCLACFGCNVKKKDENTLINDFSAYGDQYSNFPLGSKNYKIIHPHYDSYSKHLKEDRLICLPRNGSLKGIETIKICKLNRFDLLYTRARLKSRSNQQLTSALAGILTDMTINKSERDIAQKMINTIVERYNYLKKF
jgi:uncharacterized protein (TIGR02646 family)